VRGLLAQRHEETHNVFRNFKLFPVLFGTISMAAVDLHGQTRKNNEETT
jgi:hypothetical protein